MISSLFAQVIEKFKENWRKVTLFAFVVCAVAVALQLIMVPSFVGLESATKGGEDMISVLIQIIRLVALAFVLLVLCIIPLYYGAIKGYLSLWRDDDIKLSVIFSAYKDGALGRAVGAYFWALLIMILWLIVPIVLFVVLMSAVNPVVATAIYIVLVLVVYIMFMLRYLFVPYLVVAEREVPVTSTTSRSAQLFKSNKMNVVKFVISILLLSIPAYVVSIVAMYATALGGVAIVGIVVCGLIAFVLSAFIGMMYVAFCDTVAKENTVEENTAEETGE